MRAPQELRRAWERRLRERAAEPVKLRLFRHPGLKPGLLRVQGQVRARVPEQGQVLARARVHTLQSQPYTGTCAASPVPSKVNFMLTPHTPVATPVI